MHHAKNHLDQTPLHLAAGHGQTEAITALADAKAMLDARDERSRTPLHHAALFGQTEAITALA